MGENAYGMTGMPIEVGLEIIPTGRRTINMNIRHLSATDNTLRRFTGGMRIETYPSSTTFTCASGNVYRKHRGEQGRPIQK